MPDPVAPQKPSRPSVTDAAPLFSLRVPRLFALNKRDLVANAPDHAVGIIAARAALEGAISLLCLKDDGSAPAIDEVPQQIDFSTCRQLDVCAFGDGIAVRLCDDTRDRTVMFQTVITSQAWDQKQSLVRFAAGTVARAMKKSGAQPD